MMTVGIVFRIGTEAGACFLAGVQQLPQSFVSAFIQNSIKRRDTFFILSAIVLGIGLAVAFETPPLAEVEQNTAQFFASQPLGYCFGAQ